MQHTSGGGGPDGGQKTFIPSDSDHVDDRGYGGGESSFSSRPTVITYRQLPSTLPGSTPLITGHLYTAGRAPASSLRWMGPGPLESTVRGAGAGADVGAGASVGGLSGAPTGDVHLDSAIVNVLSGMLGEDVSDDLEDAEMLTEGPLDLWEDDDVSDGNVLVWQLRISWFEEEVEDSGDLRNLGDLLCRPLCRDYLAELVDKCGWQALRIREFDCTLKPFESSDRKGHLEVLLLAEKTRLGLADRRPLPMPVFFDRLDLDALYGSKPCTIQQCLEI